MSDPDKADTGRAAALRQEHEELVSLFIHEDYVGWQLNLALLAANAGLFAGARALGLFNRDTKVGLALLLGLLAGSMMNIVGFFIGQRLRVRRLSRLFRARRIEAELKRLDVPIQTFESVEGNIHEGRMPTPPDETNETRPLHWWERVAVLDLRFAVNALAATFLALALWTLLGRPGLG